MGQGVFGSITITFDHFDAANDKLADLVDEALEKAARDIEAKAKMNAPVDTGNLRAAIYSASPKHSTYGQGGATNTQGEESIGKHEAVVHAGAPYSVFVDYGTVHTPANPFFSSAVADVQPTIVAVMAKIIGEGLK